MNFTINGERVTLEADDICRAVRSVNPGTVRSHVVEVDGTDYPVKQVFAEATGIDLLDFTTNQARRVLKALGFTLKRVE